MEDPVAESKIVGQAERGHGKEVRANDCEKTVAKQPKS